jgi:hypothetical protein
MYWLDLKDQASKDIEANKKGNFVRQMQIEVILDILVMTGVPVGKAQLCLMDFLKDTKNR